MASPNTKAMNARLGALFKDSKWPRLVWASVTYSEDPEKPGEVVRTANTYMAGKNRLKRRYAEMRRALRRKQVKARAKVRREARAQAR